MTRFYRRVVTIRATDSPNVRFALAQIAAGKTPTDDILVPGVLPYSDYKKRRETWDEIRQAVGLDAVFYEGSELMLMPQSWLTKSAEVADQLANLKKRDAKAIGIDPGEGSAKTVMTCIDDLGVIEERSKLTTDTSEIQNDLIAFGRETGVPPSRWMFDMGGGGRQIAHYMRRDGYPVLGISFGEGVVSVTRRGMTPFSQRLDLQDAKRAYKNRRAQMYGDLAAMIDPTAGTPFAIPRRFHELHRQLGGIPKKWDSEGKLILPPKNRRSNDSHETTMTDILGCSPDEADALVIAVHCMVYGDTRPSAGAVMNSKVYYAGR